MEIDLGVIFVSIIGLSFSPAEFTTDTRYVKGETNFVADALSRPTASAIKRDAVINYKDLSADQALDTEFIRLRHSTSSTIEFRLLKTFDDVLVKVRNINRTYQTVRIRKIPQESVYNTARFSTPFSQSHETSHKFSFCVVRNEYRYCELVQILHRLSNC